MESSTPFSSNQPSPASIQQRPALHNSPNSLNARSCVTCRRRKVKCDKILPCSHCVKGGSKCVYPAPGRAPRRPRQGGKVVSEREADLIKRLKRLEGVVEELSGQVELDAIRQHTPSTENSPPLKDTDSIDSKTHTVRVVGMDEGSKSSWLATSLRIGGGPPKPAFNLDAATQGLGKLVLDEGKSRYVASSFWASISDEVDDIKGILERDDLEYSSDDSAAPARPTDTQTEPNHQSFLMGYNSSDVNMMELHPPPSEINFYWQTFLDNVHPMSMLLHAPTMTKTIKEVQNNLDSLSPSTEALMFSIYFATITSMSKEEVLEKLGAEKDNLAKKYRFGIEQALARAGFLNTSEIVTIQAFVLFLICVRRHDDTQFVWSLTGLALRLAQSLGVHRDGVKLGLSPFDTEMRRRLWWQICVLDVRASEDHGSDPSIVEYSFDTAYPTSINDDDISPDADKFPTAREGVSEMTFTLIRCEICSLLRRISHVPPGFHEMNTSMTLSVDEKETLVKETSLRVEDKYLKYCDNAGPLFWVAAIVARLVITKMKIFIHHPMIQPGNQMSLSPEIRDSLFISCIEMIEYSRILEDEATTKQWGWLFHTYVQWHAIAFVLGELAERDNSEIVERAWRAMHGVFDAWGGTVVLNKRHMLWQPMRQLMARARRRREQNKQKLREEESVLTNNAIESETTSYAPAPGNFVDPSILPSNGDQQYMHIPQDPTMYALNNAPLAGAGMLAPEQVQHQSQQQQFSLPQWSMDNSFLDVDMAGLGNDLDWNGWNDMVRDYQLDADALNNNAGRGTALGGMGTMGNWW